MANSAITAPTFIQINATSVQTLGAAVKALLFPLKGCLQALCARASKTLTTDGLATMDGPVVMAAYAKAALPSAATYIYGLIYVTDDVGGATPAFSDGTNWRRTADRNVIS